MKFLAKQITNLPHTRTHTPTHTHTLTHTCTHTYTHTLTHTRHTHTQHKLTHTYTPFWTGTDVFASWTVAPIHTRWKVQITHPIFWWLLANNVYMYSVNTLPNYRRIRNTDQSTRKQLVGSSKWKAQRIRANIGFRVFTLWVHRVFAENPCGTVLEFRASSSL